MSHEDDTLGGRTRVEEELAGLAARAPEDFAARVLRRVGVPSDRYDTYLWLEAPAGGLFVAWSPEGVTGAAPGSTLSGPRMFEERHHARTGRTAIPTNRALPGLTSALRTGRTARLPIDWREFTPVERAILDAVRGIPRGQLRPLTWVVREASLPDTDAVRTALALNPAPLLIPCHRVTHDEGGACDLACGPETGARLRTAEGITEEMTWLPRSGLVFLGSDTTRVYCHPTCAHARRITPPHRVPFVSADAARTAGYRPCKSCRPIAA
ncbi:Ada metal-binding domain-containing protein [Actinomadura oligospora]|uniref:Ada metal-binding domain-containing protein n=1 Tax=Actinomadura oligospora TaxID=111804 RepID=UPI0004B524FC|nr:Ada metal-binding domain-containing protein [Actinomadura oligospora]